MLSSTWRTESQASPFRTLSRPSEFLSTLFCRAHVHFPSPPTEVSRLFRTGCATPRSKACGSWSKGSNQRGRIASIVPCTRGWCSSEPHRSSSGCTRHGATSIGGPDRKARVKRCARGRNVSHPRRPLGCPGGRRRRGASLGRTDSRECAGEPSAAGAQGEGFRRALRTGRKPHHGLKLER